MAHSYKGFSINNNHHIKYCPIHGESNHDNRTEKCIRCAPSKDKGMGVDHKAVARRRAIEFHQERVAAKLKDDWFGE